MRCVCISLFPGRRSTSMFRPPPTPLPGPSWQVSEQPTKRRSLEVEDDEEEHSNSGSDSDSEYWTQNPTVGIAIPPAVLEEFSTPLLAQSNKPPFSTCIFSSFAILLSPTPYLFTHLESMRVVDRFQVSSEFGFDYHGLIILSTIGSLK